MPVYLPDGAIAAYLWEQTNGPAVVLALLPTHQASAYPGAMHCVRPGETLYRIALMHGTSVWSIAAANGIAGRRSDGLIAG